MNTCNRVNKNKILIKTITKAKTWVWNRIFSLGKGWNKNKNQKCNKNKVWYKCIGKAQKVEVKKPLLLVRIFAVLVVNALFAKIENKDYIENAIKMGVQSHLDYYIGSKYNWKFFLNKLANPLSLKLLKL